MHNHNLDTIFKAYDIRGRVPDELDAATARAVGQALAGFLPAGQVVVGRDMRADSAELAEALIGGLTAQGRDVLDIGQCTSDMIYYAVGAITSATGRPIAGGAMITASHLGAGSNGIKLTGPRVAPIGADSGLANIKAAVAAGQFALDDSTGRAITKRNITDDFVRHVVQIAQRNFGDITAQHIGYDAGNGMAGIFVEPLRQQTPLQIEGLYLEPDGSFPNHPANPAVEQNLAALRQLDIRDHLVAGVAFDGDGDRAFLVDEHGQILSASQLGCLIISRLLQQPQHLHRNAKIIYTPTVSRIVPETIAALGGMPIICRVGHSFIKAKMHEVDAIFGLEEAGHFYFADNFGADSGLLVALSGLAILSQSQSPLSDLVASYRTYHDSGELNFAVRDVPALMRALWQQYSDGEVSEVDGLSISYPDWWFNVRASNTEPIIRLNVEATSAAILSSNASALTALIHNHK